MLAGEPGDDAWEPIAHLLTTDDDGYPRVCLLSRAELATAGTDAAGCVVRARRTIANLRRDGQALLVVTGEQAAHYIRLRVRTILGSEDGTGRAAIAFDVTGAQADALGVPLRPMTFRASAALRSYERWDENRALLERVAAVAAGGGTE